MFIKISGKKTTAVFETSHLAGISYNGKDATVLLDTKEEVCLRDVSKNEIERISSLLAADKTERL